MPPVVVPVYIPRRLAQSLPTGTGDSTVYSVPGGSVTIVKQIIVANVGTVSALASISFVPNGLAVADGNRLCKEISVEPKRVVVFDLSQVMASGDFISVRTSVASTLVFTASGVETTLLDLPLTGLEVAEAGVIAGTRPRINFIEGANISLTVLDDAVNGEVDVTVAVSGNLGHVIKDEGTPLATRAGLNFSGDSVAASDDAVNDETDVAINHPAAALHSTPQPAAPHTHAAADITDGGQTDALVFMGGF